MEWTISDGLYGSLRRKGSSHAGIVTLGFCQRAIAEVAEDERCRHWRGTATAALANAQIHALSANVHYSGKYYSRGKEKYTLRAGHE